MMQGILNTSTKLGAPSALSVLPQFVASLSGIDVYTDFTAVTDGPIPANHAELALPVLTCTPLPA